MEFASFQWLLWQRRQRDASSSEQPRSRASFQVSSLVDELNWNRGTKTCCLFELWAVSMRREDEELNSGTFHATVSSSLLPEIARPSLLTAQRHEPIFASVMCRN